MKYFFLVSARAWALVGLVGVCAEYVQSGYVTLLIPLWVPFVLAGVFAVISLSYKTNI